MKKRLKILGCVILLLFLAGGCASSEDRLTGPEIPVQEDADTEHLVAEEAALETEEAALAAEEPETEKPEPEKDLHPYDFTVAFAGDVNFGEEWNTMDYYRQQENGIYDCIDPQLIGMMQDADLMCLNLECTISSVGSPMNGKKYTFRANPSRIEILKELGVDVANLANNHVYDYGKDAFLDTLALLTADGISYVGAGADAADAQRPYYTELDGKTIAIVSASRAEKYILTPEASETEPGVFRCYDTTRLLEVTREAKSRADMVIVYIHWGTEYSEELEEAQINGARELVEAGADVVLGAHPHCLQGMEFCEEVPVLYSLGNYWFNEKTLDSVLVKLHFYGNDEEQHLDTILVPARQEDHYTGLLTEPEDVEGWKEHIIRMSPSPVMIDGEGILKDGDQEGKASELR